MEEWTDLFTVCAAPLPGCYVNSLEFRCIPGERVKNRWLISYEALSNVCSAQKSIRQYVNVSVPALSKQSEVTDYLYFSQDRILLNLSSKKKFGIIFIIDSSPNYALYYQMYLFFLEKAMAPHSSTLAWKIPWMEEPGRLRSMGSLRVGHDWATSLSCFTFMHWRREWQPTPVFLPGESQGQGSLVGCHLWGRTESDMTEAT